VFCRWDFSLSITMLRRTLYTADAPLLMIYEVEMLNIASFRSTAVSIDLFRPSATAPDGNSPEPFSSPDEIN